MQCKKIREIRESKGMKAAELARLANISHPFLFDLERGARSASLGTLERIATALGVTVDELIKRTEPEDGRSCGERGIRSNG